MESKSTAEHISLLAATVAGKEGSVEDAVARAVALYEAADRTLRAEEIADDAAMQNAYAEAEKIEALVPSGKRMTIAEGWERFDGKLGGKRFKTPGGLERAMIAADEVVIAEVNGIKVTTVELLERFRKSRMQADSKRKTKSSNGKMSGASIGQTRKVRHAQRNSLAEAAPKVRNTPRKKRKF